MSAMSDAYAKEKNKHRNYRRGERIAFRSEGNQQSRIFRGEVVRRIDALTYLVTDGTGRSPRLVRAERLRYAAEF